MKKSANPNYLPVTSTLSTNGNSFRFSFAPHSFTGYGGNGKINYFFGMTDNYVLVLIQHKNIKKAETNDQIKNTKQ
jgi:hypothetical protein